MLCPAKILGAVQPIHLDRTSLPVVTAPFKRAQLLFG